MNQVLVWTRVQHMAARNSRLHFVLRVGHEERERRRRAAVGVPPEWLAHLNETAPARLYNPDTTLKVALQDTNPQSLAVSNADADRRLGDLLAEIKEPYEVQPLIRDGMCFDQTPKNTFWTALWEEQNKGDAFPHLIEERNPEYAKLDAHMTQMWKNALNDYPNIVHPPDIPLFPDGKVSFSDRVRSFDVRFARLYWHDDRSNVDDFDQHLVVMLATLEGNDDNTRAGTLIRESTGHEVYQSAAWNGQGAFALTIFPSTSVVYDHAAPLGTREGARRRSLTWRLPTLIGHTKENNAEYEKLIRYVRNSLMSFDGGEIVA